MSKPYTEADLSDQMDRDLIWRLKELSDMKSAIHAVESSIRPALLRGLIALVYAHWEGHVRQCAMQYFHYIALRKRPYNELEDQIYFNSFLARLDAFFRSKGSVEEKCKLLDDVVNSGTKRFSRLNASLIDTKSNLNSSVLRDICIVCGISYSHFKGEESFIDIVLLKRRNQIAHGEEVYVQLDEVDDLIDRSIALMRMFGNVLENKIYLKSYLAKTDSATSN